MALIKDFAPECSWSGSVLFCAYEHSHGWWSLVVTPLVQIIWGEIWEIVGDEARLLGSRFTTELKLQVHL